MTRIEDCDTAVIGGGIIGCSIAYHLARLDMRSVVVLERNALASGSTSRAAALLTQVRPKTAQIPLVQRTHAAIRELQDELADSLGLRRTGSLQVAASPESQTDLVHLAWVAESHGIPFRWADPSEVARMVPWLDTGATRSLAFMADDAIIDPYLLATGYARAARNRGVVFRSGVEVTGLLCSGRTVEGVRTSNGDIRARNVVDAGGAWAGLLARGVGVGLPMAPVRSHYWITAPESGFPRDMPYVILPDASAYVRPELGGLIIGLREPVSLSVDPRTIPTDITGVSFGDEADGWQILMEGRERLLAFYPTLDEAQFVRFIAGLSTYTPDGQFVLGAVPDLQGYVVATGCCGAGIAASGGIGLAVAEIVAGRPNSFDLTPFWPTRFNGIDPVSLAFRARCAAARSAKVSG